VRGEVESAAMEQPGTSIRESQPPRAVPAAILAVAVLLVALLAAMAVWFPGVARWIPLFNAVVDPQARATAFVILATLGSAALLLLPIALLRLPRFVDRVLWVLAISLGGLGAILTLAYGWTFAGPFVPAVVLLVVSMVLVIRARRAPAAARGAASG
jgi:hypothetical protein